MRPCKFFSVCLVVLTCLPSLVFAGPLRRLIANGKDSDVKEFPFVVALARSDDHAEDRVDDPTWRNSLFVSCTGTLLRDNIVITAAHCVNEIAERDFSVKGLWVLADTPRVPPVEGDLNRGSAHKVHAVIMNPDYMPSEGTADDIALLLLSTPVPAMTLTGVARAFPKLPSNDLLKLCLAVTQVGYSLNTPEIFDGKAWLKPAHTMSQMTGTMTGLGNRGHISMFRVAADPQTGAQISYGDSGGPALVRDSKGDWVLVGVTAAETYCKTGIISAIFQQKSFVTQTLYNFWKMSAQMKLQNFFAKVFVDPWKSVKGDLKRITLMKEVLEPRLTLSKKGNENTRTNDLDITVVKEDLLRNAYGLPAPSGFNHSSVVEAKVELSKGLTWGNVRNYVQRCGVLVAGFLDLTDEQRLGSEFSPEMKMDIVTCANNMRTLWDFSARLISWNKNRELNPELAACPLGVFFEDAHFVGPPITWELAQCPALPSE